MGIVINGIMGIVINKKLGRVYIIRGVALLIVRVYIKGIYIGWTGKFSLVFSATSHRNSRRGTQTW